MKKIIAIFTLVLIAGLADLADLKVGTTTVLGPTTVSGPHVCRVRSADLQVGLDGRSADLQVGLDGRSADL